MHFFRIPNRTISLSKNTNINTNTNFKGCSRIHLTAHAREERREMLFKKCSEVLLDVDGHMLT